MSWELDRDLQFVHPEMAERLNLWRMSEFVLERIPSPADVYLFRGVGRSNPKDERLFALAEVRELSVVRDEEGRVVSLPELEHALTEALESLRRFQARRSPRERLLWNRVRLNVWPDIELSPEEAGPLIDRYARETEGLGIETVIIQGRLLDPRDGQFHDRELRLFAPAGRGVIVELDDPATRPLQPLDEGARRIVQARRRGSVHPAELVKVLAPERADRPRGIPRGEFVEHDLDADGHLVPVDRPPAMNEAGIVVGVTRSFTDRHPEGMQRVVLLGDPTKALGSVAEPECRRIMAALDLAEELGVPVEWFALSSGARIAMDSGTENMDWVAAALRRIIEFTQAGGEINVVVTGINVGAQPYWNAEATMLMHTRGILVMAPESAMVLTGKQALDFAGGVSAEDNFGIGGYDRIMGPNGQAQYWAPDLAGACAVLHRYYAHAYVAPGERFPRRAETRDALERDVREAPHSAPGSELATVGDIFSDETNPGRKQAFDIRSVMRAVVGLRPRAAGALGADARRRGRRRLGRAPRRLADDRDRDRVAPDRPLRPDARRRAVAVDVGHAVPEVARRRSRARSTPTAGAGRWWCWRTWPASTARRSRCASGSSSTAPRSAARSSTSAARSCSASSRATTAARSWSSRSG